MHGKPSIKFKEDAGFVSPEAAARKLVELAKAEMAGFGQPHAYTGTVNSSFTRSGGTVSQYRAGIEYAVAQGWLKVDLSGTRIHLEQKP